MLQETPVHLVMFPFLAFGHINPFIQLSNKLSSHGIRISFFSIPAFISHIESLLIPSTSTQIIPLEIPPVTGLTANTAGTSDLPPSEVSLIFTALDLMQPQIKALLSQLKPHFVVFDFAQHWIPQMASELGINTLCFSVFAAITNSYVTVPARLTGVEGKITVSDLKKPPPGFPPNSTARLKTFEAQKYLSLYASSDGAPRVFDRATTGRSGSSAIIMKTCQDMEGPYLDFMKTQFKIPFLLTGPLVPEPTSGELEEKWAKWLGQFPPRTVIFCSFGSETFLEDDQIRELTLGLERTGLPFFLVLNFPKKLDAIAELSRVLPEGFTERVKERGVVHTGWVQQQLILAHDSVGCYLSHSGLSSVIEALVNDCQLALLPCKADQFLNTKLFADDLKCAVEVNRRNEDGYFGKDDIYDAVKMVMIEVEKEPGRTVRSNHQKWTKFVQDKRVQDQFMSDVVAQIKALVPAEQAFKA